MKFDLTISIPLDDVPDYIDGWSVEDASATLFLKNLPNRNGNLWFTLGYILHQLLTPTESEDRIED